MTRLSKSIFLKGRQCPRRAWLAVHQPPEPAIELEEIWEEREAEGAAVERLAMSLFPGARRIVDALDDVELEERREQLEFLIAESRQALTQGQTAFQVHLATEQLLAIADVLEASAEGWYLWEIKASTSHKPIFDFDLAFQVEVARRCGLAIAGTGIILLDPDYVRGEELDAIALLRKIDRTQEVGELASSVAAMVGQQLQALAADSVPAARPSNNCKGNPNVRSADRPSTCGHLGSSGFCGSQLPEHWIGHLPKVQGNKKIEFLSRLTDIRIQSLDADDRDVSWTDNQRRVIRAVQTNSVQVDLAAIREQLSKLVWPVVYVDFEFDPGMAIPRFPGTKPYTRIPFQWSAQIQRVSGAALDESLSFLHTTEDDPRWPFWESLSRIVPPVGSIVVHSRAAETTVLDQLAEALGGDVPNIVAGWKARIVDTVDMAMAGYYHPAQHGSYSIKKLAPAMLGRGYDDLDIQSGMAAVVAWRRACNPSISGEQRDALRACLIQYCGRDTRLMHDIVTKLTAIAAG